MDLAGGPGKERARGNSSTGTGNEQSRRSKKQSLLWKESRKVFQGRMKESSALKPKPAFTLRVRGKGGKSLPEIFTCGGKGRGAGTRSQSDIPKKIRGGGRVQTIPRMDAKLRDLRGF